jgi:UDP-N-acetylmuramoylalanine--D-glutamate ligase
VKVVVLGYGDQGKSAYEYWKKLGDDVAIRDSREDIEMPEGASFKLGPDFLKDLDQFDLIVRAAPSIHPRDIGAANSPAIFKKVTSNTNEFFRVCPTKNIIGITGTKGKGTTSTLTARMLESFGKKVHLGGNIGIPPLELLKDGIEVDDWVVLEIANFQLIDIHYSPPIAACLMVEPEHLNWHADMEEYVLSKAQLFEYQKPEDIAIYYSENEISKSIADHSKGLKIPYYKTPGAYIKNDAVVIDDKVICQTNELKLLGTHNWQNVCAAVTVVWQISQDVSAIKSVLTTFGGLEHRLEFVRELDGVKYYNDSFASGPGSCSAALDAIKGPKVVIMGGLERGIPLDGLVETTTQHNDDLRKVVIIGESAKRLASELSEGGFTNYVLEPSKDINVIVATAKSYTESGDSLILSPGFASFDMFKNFTERGLQFKAAVERL